MDSSCKSMPLYWLLMIALHFCLIGFYAPLMHACLMFTNVSGTADLPLFLFQGWSHVLARQGMVEFFHVYAEESIFLSPEWYLALEDFKNNQSIIEFTVEQMIISRIASVGLKFGGNNSIPVASILAFLESVVALSKDKLSILYVPMKFNLRVINALYVAVDRAKEIAQVIAIQITLAKRHKNFAAAFFVDWDQWIKLLHGFTVEATLSRTSEEWSRWSRPSSN